MEGIDYTMKEYLKLVEKTRACVERLNSQGGSWTPHKVELAVWTHYICRDLKPELLEDMPGGGAARSSPTKLQPAVNGSEPEQPAAAAAESPEEPAAADDSKSPSPEPANNGDGEKTVNGVNGVDAAAETHSLDENSKDTTSSVDSAVVEAEEEPAAQLNGAPATSTEEAKDTQESSSSAAATSDEEKTSAADTANAAAENGGGEDVALTNGSAAETGRANGNEEEKSSSSNGATAAAAENGANGTQVNGIQANGDSTDETAPAAKRALETGNEAETAPPPPPAKRALDSDEVQAHDAKRLKEEPATQPIPAGGN